MTTALIPRTTVTEICAHRDAAMSKMRSAVDGMVASLSLVKDANDYAQMAHGLATFTLEDRSKSEAYQRLFASIDPAKSLEAYRQQIDARVWMNILALTGMENMMDRTEKEKLYNQLCKDVPEVTEDTIYATLESLRADAGFIFQRGLARAFIGLDRRFRSHDGFKIGARIVLTRVFDESGYWSRWGGMSDTISDIERVFIVLDGKNKPDSDGKMPSTRGLINAIEKDRAGHYGARQSKTDSTYFRINTFMNGNAHLWFTDDGLVEKANKILADYYGSVLPDGVPADVTEQDIRSKSTALCKDLSYYPTPAEVVDLLLAEIHVDKGDRCLEPSAGTGAIVTALLAKGATVDAIEVNPSHVAVLRTLVMMGNLTVTHANFLTRHPVPVYDVVVMNPPFFGTHYAQHVMLAFEFLKPGGRLIAVLPATVEFGETKAHDAFRAWVKKHSDQYGSPFTDLPLESFAKSGTRVSTCYVKLRK